MSYKEILVISVGTTPQVITEALYHYYSTTPGWAFEEIKVLTTTQGEKTIIEALFKESRLNALETALGIPKGEIPFTKKDIMIVKDVDGNALDDIRGSENNSAIMGLVFQVLEEITNDDNTRLTATVAGGRKTMSVALGLGMNLYAREQDSLIHIMVDDSLFNNRDWFFPDDPSDPKQRIEVGEIPFIRLNDEATRRMDVSNPDRVLEIAQTRIDNSLQSPEIRIRKAEIICGDQHYKLSPSEIRLLRYFLKIKTEGCVEPDLEFCGDCRACFVTHDQMIEDFERITDEHFEVLTPHSGNWEQLETFLEQLNNRRVDLRYQTMDDLIRQNRTKLKTALNKKISDYKLVRFLAPETDKSISGESRRYGVLADKNAISID